MVECELCGIDRGRRKRVDGKMLCWHCVYSLRQTKETLAKEISQKLANIHRLQDELYKERNNKYQVKFEKKGYQYSNPVSAVPSLDILQRAIMAVDLLQYFSNFSEVMCDYYGIKAPRYLINDDKVPNDANAVYSWGDNIVYTPKRGALKWRTAFHEIWHALERHAVVSHTEESEKNAEIFAKACLRRLGLSENS